MSKEDNKTKPKPPYNKILSYSMDIPFKEVILQDGFRNYNQINFKYFPGFYASAGIGNLTQR
ncbi:hypothetical protein ACISMV_04385 [Campylobacter jejuni]